jgi:hypothetical protein
VVDEIIEEVEGLIEEAQTVVLSEENLVDELMILLKGVSVEHTDLKGFLGSNFHVHVELLIDAFPVLKSLCYFVLHKNY